MSITQHVNFYRENLQNPFATYQMSFAQSLIEMMLRVVCSTDIAQLSWVEIMFQVALNVRLDTQYQTFHVGVAVVAGTRRWMRHKG
mmetsp:Transcript_115281/g.200690  ORF Transcript_115281/g.200690 Transcript_115281/m.200690 type:complete len:86 (+) Transcript_115281:67-324(+)